MQIQEKPHHWGKNTHGSRNKQRQKNLIHRLNKKPRIQFLGVHLLQEDHAGTDNTGDGHVGADGEVAQGEEAGNGGGVDAEAVVV